MGSLTKLARRPLADFLDFMWISEGYAQPHAAERLLPTGRMGMVLSLDPRGQGHDVVCGARTSSLVLDTSKPLSLIGISFKTGGGFPFFAQPMGEFQDRSIPLDALWGVEARILREQLLEAHTACARFAILERFLLGHLSHHPVRHPAVQFAIGALQKTAIPRSVASVTQSTGLSSRRLIELFRREVGMTPKVFSRLCRFRSVVAGIDSAAAVDWAATATACGYFDQAHLIHDFNRFAGMSPTAYIRNRTASLNHVRASG